MKPVTPFAASVFLAFGLACAGAASSDSPAPVPLELRDDLAGGCFGRPARAFSPENFAKDEIFVQRGDRAWEFELTSTKGDTVRLSELLASKPVLLVSGSYTCPVYQKNRKKLDEMAEMFADDLHVVLVYGPEAHPLKDPSPYRGDEWAKEDKFSHMGEPASFEERMEHALRLKGDTDLLTLVEPMDNPVWCTYGTAPNAAYLIKQDGTFDAVHDWFDAKTMAGSIAALIGFEGDLREERWDDGKGDRRGGRGRRNR